VLHTQFHTVCSTVIVCDTQLQSESKGHGSQLQTCLTTVCTTLITELTQLQSIG
jgi:hypothetical protein